MTITFHSNSPEISLYQSKSQSLGYFLEQSCKIQFIAGDITRGRTINPWKNKELKYEMTL